MMMSQAPPINQMQSLPGLRKDCERPPGQAKKITDCLHQQTRRGSIRKTTAVSGGKVKVKEWVREKGKDKNMATM